MSKSAIYTAMTTPTTAAINSTLPLGTTVRRFGCNVLQDGNGISATGKGYYLVNADISAAPTAAGTITVSLYKDGVPVLGGTGSASVSTAGNSVTIPINAIVRNVCDCDSSFLSFVVTGAAATINNVALSVTKL